MNVAVIPARGGSKRIPKKNIRQFCGKPIIAWPIEVAQKSKLFDHILVSTDDEEIAAVAKSYGAEVPFMRPVELADDFTGTEPVIAHALKQCINMGWDIEYACCIYSTSPFLQVEDLRSSKKLLNKLNANFCFPVTEFPSSVQRALTCDEQGKLHPLYPEYELTRTQDIKAAYYDVGQFYWGRTDAWMNNPKLHSQGIGYIIPNWRVVDIDNLDDWKRAELLFHNFKEDLNE